MPGARPARSAPMSAVALGALVRITFACLPSSKTTYASTNVTACRLQFQDSTMKTVLFGLFAAICTTAVASEPGTPTATPRDWATQPTAPQAGLASDNTGRERAQDGTTALP